MKIIELTREQQNKWNDTLVLFTFHQPGFRHLLYRLLDNNDGGHIAIMTDEIPVAATDGSNVLINPEKFFMLGLPQRVFVLAHEILHCVYDDPSLLRRLIKTNEIRYHDGVKLPFDNHTLQIAADLRINAMLISSRVGKMPDGEFAGHYDETGKIATSEDSVLEIYRRIYEKGDGGKGGDGSKGGFDKILMPGTTTNQHPSEVHRNQGQWATEMAQAQHMQKARGDISADLQRMFDMFLKPQVPWTEHIRGFFARRLGSGASDWRRPDRRLIVRDIYCPGRAGHGVNWVCVWGDTSGSISREELNTYFGELGGLIEELNPRKVTVFWCDSAIKNEDEVTDASDLATIKARGVGGGGGTSCVPVFNRIREMGMEDPDALVCLTDGHATFPDQAPSYPVIWACTTEAPIPFGEVVHIEVQQQEA